MGDEKRCPVIYGHGSADKTKPGPRSISMALAERAWSVYDQKWRCGQTLERMIERGGFHAGELDEYVQGWRDEEYELTRLRAAIARIREICAVEYDAASDLRRDVLDATGGEA